VIIWSPIAIVDAPAGTETRKLSIIKVEVPGEEYPNVGTANVVDDLPLKSTTTTPVGVRLNNDPSTVTGGPFKNAVLVPIITLVASGTAEMTWPLTVAIGIGAIVGLGMKVLEPVFPPIKMPDEATDITTA
jgi:hypothetical protein